MVFNILSLTNKFNGRSFARVLYFILMKDTGRWLPWMLPGSTGRFFITILCTDVKALVRWATAPEVCFCCIRLDTSLAGYVPILFGSVLRRERTKMVTLHAVFQTCPPLFRIDLSTHRDGSNRLNSALFYAALLYCSQEFTYSKQIDTLKLSLQKGILGCVNTAANSSFLAGFFFRVRSFVGVQTGENWENNPFWAQTKHVIRKYTPLGLRRNIL